LHEATFARRKLGEGGKVGEPCPNVRFNQNRLPIEPFAYFAQLSFAQMSLNQITALKKPVILLKCLAQLLALSYAPSLSCVHGRAHAISGACALSSVNWYPRSLAH
jgi:hypothetical protein